MPLKKLKIAVSACLLGMRYRYDGQAKLNKELVNSLYNKVDIIPVCPEVECGLEIPRPKMRLELSSLGTRLKIIDSRQDITLKMEEWAETKIQQLEKKDIAAFLCKSKSPSCALNSASIFTCSGRCVHSKGQGLFTRLLKQKNSKILIKEENDLKDFIKLLNLDVFQK